MPTGPWRPKGSSRNRQAPRLWRAFESLWREAGSAWVFRVVVVNTSSGLKHMEAIAPLHDEPKPVDPSEAAAALWATETGELTSSTGIHILPGSIADPSNTW